MPQHTRKERIKRWLLRRLIRHMLVTFQLRDLMRLIWDEHERIFYEDNAPTRRAHIEDMIP